LVSDTKPRLVFFQFRYDDKLPEFLLIHKRDHVNCLSHFFDVRVIDHDCDYQQVCDTYEPDLALFESGLNHPTCKRLNITNIRGNARVPRLALHNADAFCNARSGLLSDMDHWGIETLFTITTTAAEHMPALADRIFAWPNCIDPETYRDYSAWKSIPVLFSGNTSSLYPWRQAILRLVSERYPSLICPHPGYQPTRAVTQFLYGEPYARMINASAIVPACGTVANEIIRKHFEIPGSNACLLTERSAPLEAAGFVDMDNCVFADDKNVLDKLDYLFKNQDELRRITARGYELVHSRHAQRNRDQIYRWFCLQRTLRSDQRIVQNGPFGDLTSVDRTSGTRSNHVNGDGLHLRLLRDGDEQLRRGNHAAAEAAYLKCHEYLRWMPEPRFGVAFSRLCRGDAATAHRWLSEQLEFILGAYGAVDPDPVEWAYYALTLLCLGRGDDAARAVRDFPWLRHPELDRMRLTISGLTDTEEVRLSDSKPRHTIHRMPATSQREWLDRIDAILRACGQPQLAERLAVSNHSRSVEKVAPMIGEPGALAAGDRTREAFRRRFRQQDRGSAFKRVASRLLHRLESRVGYFLPYRVSAMKRDEFFATLRKLAAEQRVSRVLVVGAVHNGSAEALLAGIADAGGTPDVFCIGQATAAFTRFEAAFTGRIECRHLRSSSPEQFAAQIEAATSDIERERDVHSWDAVMVNGSLFDHPRSLNHGLERRLRGSRLTVVEGTGNIAVSDICHRLLDDRNYALVATNPGLRAGYVIFKRVAAKVDAAGLPAAAWPGAAPTGTEFEPRTQPGLQTVPF
jgi:hypothetical protein